MEKIQSGVIRLTKLELHCQPSHHVELGTVALLEYAVSDT